MTKVYFKKIDEYDLEKLKEYVRNCFSELGVDFKKGSSVLVKPNFLLAKNADSPVITNPVLIRAVLEVLIEKKLRPFIYEIPSMGSVENAAKKCGLDIICKELNVEIKSLGEFVSKSNDNNKHFKKLFFPKELDEADYVVNLAKLKTHSLMGLTLGIKNVFGLVKPEFRGQMHFQTGKDRDEFAHMLIDVYNLVNPDLTIIDGIIGMEGNGPANGVARKFGFVGASTHAYALDIEVAKILNTDENKIPLLKIGKKRFNIVSEPIGDEIKIDFLIKLPDTFNSNGTLTNLVYPYLKKFIQARPVVIPEKCIACLNCKNICPAKAISIRDGKAWIDDKICIKCFCCHEVCPINAIKINKPYIGRLLEKNFNKGLEDE